MKISIIYQSKFGNNEKIADFLADQFKIEDVSVYSVKEHSPKHIVHSDLYIFSTPTHMGNAPFKIRGFAKKLKVPEKFRYAIIATYINPETKAASTLSEILDSLGGIKTGSIKVKSTNYKGPLEDDWQLKIKEFSRKVLTS